MENTLPVDLFSRRLRELTDNPGAVRSTSTVQLADFYGHAETWVIDTFRVNGKLEVFVQKIASDGSVRMVLPPEVTSAMFRHRESAVRVVRRRAARAAVATKRLRGDQLGNPDALKKARAARRRKGQK